MDSLNFCYWLQGYFEIANMTNMTLNSTQVEIIKSHLQLVFKKETPAFATGLSFTPDPVGTTIPVGTGIIRDWKPYDYWEEFNKHKLCADPINYPVEYVGPPRSC